MWAAVVFKVTAKLGSKEWVQGKLKCHKSLLARSSCFLLIEYTPVSVSFWLVSRVLKKLILMVFGSLFIAFVEGWTFGVPYSTIFADVTWILPCFWWPWQFWNIGQVYCILYFSWDLFVVFLMTRLGGGTGFWEEAQRGKVPFPTHHSKCTYCQCDITVEVKLELLGEVVIVRFL